MVRPSSLAKALPLRRPNISSSRWLKSPPTPVHKTKVTMHTKRMVAIQNFWYLRKLEKGLKGMAILDLGLHSMRVGAGPPLTPREAV